jgi:hypothetical protein
VIRDLHNVRELPGEGDPAPATSAEEQRVRSVLFSELGNEIAEKGWARFPAYSTEERIRLREIGRALSEHWDRPVTVEAEDACSVLLSLGGITGRPGSPAK